MTKEEFNRQKNELLQIVSESEEKNMEDIKYLKSVIERYYFENRLHMKGTISHTLVDSLQINDDEVVDRAIWFDNGIS